VISVNVLIDPANIFKNGEYEDGILKIILSGDNVTNISNYNERDLQKRLIETGNFKPNLLIIGSSRIMEIGSDLFKDVDLINNGVSMEVLEDDLAILNMYLEQGIKPQKIILGLDPWTLNDNNPEDRWKSVYRFEYYKMLDRLGVEKEHAIKDYLFISPKYSELFSFSYFQESIKAMIWKRGKNQSVYSATKTKINNTFTKLCDGSITYDIKYRSKTPDELKSYVIGNSETLIGYSFQGFKEISNKKTEILKKLITYCKLNNIRIDLVLAPMHPYTYSFLTSQSKYSLIRETEKVMKDIAGEYHLNLYGSFDPKNMGITENYFYDELHCNPEAMKKVIQVN
jgi:vacuolar-type H+-ATPase subunit F/Vma7